MKIKNDYRADAHARTSETPLLSLELGRLTTFSDFRVNTANSVSAFEQEPLLENIKSLEALGLTRRQAEVAFWIAQGKTNDDLAIILNTSHHTIPHHVEAILARLQLATRAEIMLCVLETGWLRWPAKREGKRTAIGPKR